MYTDIDRIAELAKEDPKRQFFSIAHLITMEKMYEAFRSLRKDASAGIDGVTYQQYEIHAEEKCNLPISSRSMFPRDFPASVPDSFQCWEMSADQTAARLG
jgi:hypothetical protein